MVALIVVVLFAIVIGIYVAIARLLNNLNQLIYNKKTALAWIPVCNVYLLGKLTVNKIVGFILIAMVILTANYTVTINNISTTYTILPANIIGTVQMIYNLAVIILLIYAIVKYNRLKQEQPTVVEDKDIKKEINENNV